MMRLFAIGALAAAFCLAAGEPLFAGPPGSTLDQHALFRAVGDMYRIDPELLSAIARIESGGRAGARSPKGAEGIMQLMPATAGSFGVRDPFDPVENALGAARLIAALREHQATAGLDRARLPELLAAYNAGETAVEKYRGVPPYSETRDYVRRVLWLYLAGVAAPRRQPRAASPVFRMHGDDATLQQLLEIRKERASAGQSPPQCQ